MSESEFRERQAERAEQMARLDQAIGECREPERQIRRRFWLPLLGWWVVYSLFTVGVAWGVVRLLRGWME